MEDFGKLLAATMNEFLQDVKVRLKIIDRQANVVVMASTRRVRGHPLRICEIASALPRNDDSIAVLGSEKDHFCWEF